MDNEQAKFILRSYRPGGLDAGDPVFLEALEHAARDPELAEWFRQERELDEALGVKLRGVTPPADLKASLLAARFAARASPWRSRLTWASAVAAVLIILAALSGLFSRPAPTDTLAEFRADMLQKMSSDDMPHLDKLPADRQQLDTWLTEREGPRGISLPAGLVGKAGVGCQMLGWRGSKVVFLCYEVSPGQLAHLFVIEKTAWPDLGSGGDPRIITDGKWSTASWVADGKTYVLAGTMSAQDVKALIDT